MSKVLITRLREQRKGKVKVGDKTFIYSRPTDLDMAELHSSGKISELGQKFVVGWEGMTEDDVIGGGGTDPVPFDAALWVELYSDRVDLWTTISDAILESYRLHTASMGDVSKN